MSVVDLTEDDDNNNNNDIDVDRTPSSQSALIHTIDDDDDNDDDAVVEIAPPTHKRKRINEPAPRTNRVPSGENSMSTALPVIHENIRRVCQTHAHTLSSLSSLTVSAARGGHWTHASAIFHCVS
jgi:hypothetical protein